MRCIAEFFHDYENSYSQKRLQIFLAFIAAVVFAGLDRNIEVIGAFLTYGSLNMLTAHHETKILKDKEHEKTTQTTDNQTGT